MSPARSRPRTRARPSPPEALQRPSGGFGPGWGYHGKVNFLAFSRLLAFGGFLFLAAYAVYALSACRVINIPATYNEP
jgi:hypothetical protein